MYEKVYVTWEHDTLNGVQYASSGRWWGHILRTCFVVLPPALGGLGILVSWGCTDTVGSFLRWATGSTIKTRSWGLGEYLWRGGCPLCTNNKIRDGGNFRSIGISDRINIAIAWNLGFDRDSIGRTFRCRFHRNPIATPELPYPTLKDNRPKP